jgi:hypothetical protein
MVQPHTLPPKQRLPVPGSDPGLNRFSSEKPSLLAD